MLKENVRTTMRKRVFITIIVFLSWINLAWSEQGVTDTEILIGSCSALEGPSNI